MHTVLQQNAPLRKVKLVRPILENLARELSELKKINDIEHMIHEFDSQISSTNFGDKSTFQNTLFQTKAVSDGTQRKFKIVKPILPQSYLAKEGMDYLPTIPIAEPNVTKTSFLSAGVQH